MSRSRYASGTGLGSVDVSTGDPRGGRIVHGLGRRKPTRRFLAGVRGLACVARPGHVGREGLAEIALDVLTAAIRIASLFPDDGAAVLAEGGFPPTWEALLEGVPATSLKVDDLPARDQGDRLLVHLREHLTQTGNLRGAVAITGALVRKRVAEYGDQHPSTLAEVGALGALADRAGKPKEARQLLERAYNGLRSGAGGRDMRLAVVAGNLAWHYLRVGMAAEAEQCLEQALRIRRGAAPETTGPVAAQLGELLVRRQKVDEALPLLKEAWERYREQYGAQDPRTVARAKTLATILLSEGKESEAIPVLRLIHEASQRGTDGEARSAAAFQLGVALENAGKREESMRLVEEALRWTRENGGEEGDPHPELANRLAQYSRMVMRRGRPIEAEGLLKEALEADQIVYGDGSSEVAIRYANLGHLCAQIGRHKEAMGWLEPAASLLRSNLGDAHPHTKFAVEELVGRWIEEGKQAVLRKDFMHARAVLIKARDLARPILGEKHWTIAEIRKFNLA